MSAFGSVVRRAVFGLAVAVGVGGYGATRFVVERHRVMTSGDAALQTLWRDGAPPPSAGAKAEEPTSKQFGGGLFLMAVGSGLAGAIALPGPRRAT